jgi:uncharacterized protein (DUF1499 family)
MVRNLFSLVLACSITISSCLFAIPIWAMAAEGAQAAQIAALPGLSQVFRGTEPQALGVHDGQLAPCPSPSNCVVSQNAGPDRAIAPIAYQTDRNTARKVLLQVLQAVPRTTVVESTEDYIRVESTSRLLGFVDDAEFYLPVGEKVIHIRSASRLGESDLGVNRRRLEQIRLAMQDLGV